MDYLEELDSGTIERLGEQSRFLLGKYEEELAKDPASSATESSRSNVIALWHTIKQIYGKTVARNVANLVNSKLLLSARSVRPTSSTLLLNEVANKTFSPEIVVSHRIEVRMPHYEFFCHVCKKVFSKVLSLAEYENGEATCARCGSKEVEQTWSAFYAITSKKSA